MKVARIREWADGWLCTEMLDAEALESLVRTTRLYVPVEPGERVFLLTCCQTSVESSAVFRMRGKELVAVSLAGFAVSGGEIDKMVAEVMGIIQ
jgi:hypothetical protein